MLSIELPRRRRRPQPRKGLARRSRSIADKKTGFAGVATCSLQYVGRRGVSGPRMKLPHNQPSLAGRFHRISSPTSALHVRSRGRISDRWASESHAETTCPGFDWLGLLSVAEVGSHPGPLIGLLSAIRCGATRERGSMRTKL